MAIKSPCASLVGRAVGEVPGAGMTAMWCPVQALPQPDSCAARSSRPDPSPSTPARGAAGIPERNFSWRTHSAWALLAQALGQSPEDESLTSKHQRSKGHRGGGAKGQKQSLTPAAWPPFADGGWPTPLLPTCKALPRASFPEWAWEGCSRCMENQWGATVENSGLGVDGAGWINHFC